MDIKQLQKIVDDTFVEHFKSTPLTERINDIMREAFELSRFTDIKNLKSETGDLLSSVLQLCNESGWDAEELIKYVCLEKIPNRKLQYKSLGRKYKIAILGGAFDCVTNGHIQIAKFVLNTSKSFDEVWLLPANKHIYNKPMVDFNHRYNMCKLAAQADGRIKVFDYEYKKKLAGETYHMLKTLLNDSDYDNYNFSFIIGLDNAISFDKWINYEELERMTSFVVIPRVGYKPVENSWYLKSPHIYLHGEDNNPIMEVSSTLVRNKLKMNQDVSNLIDSEVYKYIKDNNLYLP